ncbi:MAG: TolC family protein [bacterium]
MRKIVITLILCIGFVVNAKTLTLNEAVRDALAQNPQILASIYNIEASKEREKKSYSGYMPSINFVTSYGRQTGNIAPRPGAPAGDGPTNKSYNNFGLGLTLNQTIYDFGRTSGAVGEAKARLSADSYDAEALKLSIWELVCIRYSIVFANQELLKVALRNEEVSKKYFEQAVAFFESGTKPKLDKLRLEVEFKNAEAARVSAEAALKISKNNLLAVMGVTNFYDFSVEKLDKKVFVSEDLEIVEFSENAFEERPETAAIKEKIKVSEKALKSVKSNFLPILDFTAFFSDAGTDITKLSWNWGVGVEFRWPLFTGLSTYRSMKEVEQANNALRLSLTAVEIEIKAEIEQAFENIKTAVAKIEVFKAAVESASEAAQAAESRYNTGSGNIVELIDAQAGLANSEANLVKAEFEKSVATIQWQKALGKIPSEFVE